MNGHACFAIGLLLALLGGGCAAPAVSSSRSVTVSVPFIEKLDVSPCAGNIAAINRKLSARAEAYARPIPEASVWYGEGLSMEPLLEPGTWIVTKPLPYDELQPGMVVLYTNTSGRRVAHALVHETTRGWIAAGVNNKTIDRDLVTPANLTGVIAAAFSPVAGAGPH